MRILIIEDEKKTAAYLKKGLTENNFSVEVADIVRHKVTRAGTRIDLTPKEFALLFLLAQRRGEVMSRTRIAEQVWDMNFDSDTNVVDVAVRRLRGKVDDPFEKKLRLFMCFGQLGEISLSRSIG